MFLIIITSDYVHCCIQFNLGNLPRGKKRSRATVAVPTLRRAVESNTKTVGISE